MILNNFIFSFRWRQSTLSNTLEACKTAWPVPHIESAFLPEFKIKKKNEINFEVIFFSLN